MKFVVGCRQFFPLFLVLVFWRESGSCEQLIGQRRLRSVPIGRNDYVQNGQRLAGGRVKRGLEEETFDIPLDDATRT